MNNERQFLVQRHDLYDNEFFNSLMNEGELIHYVDMLDLIDEEYKVFEVTEFGKPKQIHYVGWQPDCLIEFIDGLGNVVLRGWGTDH